MEHSAPVRIILRAVLCASLGLAISAAADNAVMSVTHTPMSAANLPEPGKDFIVSASIRNSGGQDPDVRAFVTADGALSQISPDRIYPGENKDFIAEFKLFAPLGEISYQFVAKTENGAIAPSKRFALRRQCLPRLKLDRKYPDDEANYALSLGQKADELERLITVYEQANKMVEALKAAVPIREDEMLKQTEDSHEDK